MTTPPYVMNSATGAGPNLITSANGATQYGVWYSQKGAGMIVGARNRATNTWTTHALTGGEVTEMQLPMPNTLDAASHRFPSIGYDSSGYLHVMAQMHNDLDTTRYFRYLRSVNPNDVSSWSAPTVPGEFGSNGYPQFTVCDNGDLYFFMRTGVNAASARGNTSDWRIPNGQTAWKGGDGGASGRMLWQGVLVPNAKGPGVPGDDDTTDTAYNWCAYTAQPFVEPLTWPHPGRVWMYGNRKVINDGAGTSDCLTVIYSDDAGVTWKAVDSSSVTLPIDFINTGLNAQIPAALTPASDNWQHGDISLIAVNPANGQPVITTGSVNTGNTWLLTYTGSAWTSTLMTAGRFASVGGRAGGCHPVYYRNTLWWRFTGGNHPRCQYLVNDAGTEKVQIGHGLEDFGKINYPVDDGNVSMHYLMGYDPIAYRKWGTLEWLIPDGDAPKVYSLGNHCRMAAAP